MADKECGDCKGIVPPIGPVLPELVETIAGPFLKMRLEGGPVFVSADNILAISVNDMGRAQVYLNGINLATTHNQEEVMDAISLADEISGDASVDSPLLGIARNLD